MFRKDTPLKVLNQPCFFWILLFLFFFFFFALKNAGVMIDSQMVATAVQREDSMYHSCSFPLGYVVCNYGTVWKPGN